LAEAVRLIDNKTVVDIGAKTGAFSVAMLDAGAERVYAIEPDPVHAQSLRRRLGDDERVDLMEMAIMSREDDGPPPAAPIGSLVYRGLLPQKIGITRIHAREREAEVLRTMEDLDSHLILSSYSAEPGCASASELDDMASRLEVKGYGLFVLFHYDRGTLSMTFNNTDTTAGERGSVLFVSDEVAARVDRLLWDSAAEVRRALVEKALSTDTRPPLYLPITLASGPLTAQQRRALGIETEESRRIEAGLEPEAPARPPFVGSRKLGPLYRRFRLHRVVRILNRVGLVRVRNILTPKIGWLSHHEPRPMLVPADYRTTPALDDPPSIALVTPSLNQGDFIDDTVRSVLEQDYPNLSYVIQDGGSTDQTLDVISRYESRLSAVVSGPDDGQADAINTGFAKVTGDIMGFLNSDDVLLPGTLHYVARYFQRHPDVDVVYGHRVLINEDGDEIGRWVLPRHDDRALLATDFVPQETLFWRRELWERTGARLDTSYTYAADWELLLRFAQAGARFARLPRFLGAFRVHSAQKTTAMIAAGKTEADRLRSRYGGPGHADEVWDWIAPYMRRHLLVHALYRAGILRY